MKNIFNKLIVFLVLLISVSSSLAYVCGTFGVTDENGNPRDVYSNTQNFYNVGDKVYITGSNYDPLHKNPNSCTWEIKRNGALVSSGNLTTDVNGNFPTTYLYTTTMDDVPTPISGGKEMILYVKCQDCGLNYSVFRVQYNQVPEFGTLAAIVALTGSVALFMIIRKKKEN